MNTHQKIPTLIFASIALSTLPACSGSNFFTDAFRDKQAAFASLRAGVNGSSRDDTLYALGSPTSSHAVNIASFEGEALFFADQKKFQKNLATPNRFDNLTAPFFSPPCAD